MNRENSYGPIGANQSAIVSTEDYVKTLWQFWKRYHIASFESQGHSVEGIAEALKVVSLLRWKT